MISEEVRAFSEINARFLAHCQSDMPNFRRIYFNPPNIRRPGDGNAGILAPRVGQIHKSSGVG